jgi:hypothetical protein
MRWRQVYEAQLETKLEADRMAAMLEQACHAVLINEPSLTPSAARAVSARGGPAGMAIAMRYRTAAAAPTAQPAIALAYLCLCAVVRACMQALRGALLSLIPSL